MKITAAAVQIAPRFGEIEENLRSLGQVIDKLEDATDLIVAPELVNTGYDLGGLGVRGEELAESLDGPTVGFARQLAAERTSTIVVGLLERGPDDALYDTAVVVAPEGFVTPYRKTHLFPPERDHFAPGRSLLTVPTAAGRLGMMICFEHAFPEVATALALQGAQILAIPSAVPHGFEYLLSLRSRARAQDNQVFVVASNLTGQDFCGRSLIVDPRGEVLAEAGQEETAVRATLDLEAIERERRQEPALLMRRPDLYS